MLKSGAPETGECCTERVLAMVDDKGQLRVGLREDRESEITWRIVARGIVDVEINPAGRFQD